ncbi:MAG: DsbA family protein [Candidatus Gracilibacteria bacterium]|jgi:protein-disulfide isomerase
MKKNTTFWLVIAAALALGVYVIFNLLTPKITPGTPGAVTDNDWIKGDKNSSVVLIEYSDFQCPACKSIWGVMDRITNEYGNKIVFAYRYFPLKQIHPNAVVSARAAEAAGRQGKFWEMHDVLFNYQNDWSSDIDPYNKFEKYAADLGLDTEKFKDDYNSGSVKDVVESGYNAAMDLKLEGTPTLFLNGKELKARSLQGIKDAIDEALKPAPQA